jgi:hypothetical protein
MLSADAEAMHSRWAALLANAAVGDRVGAKVLPGFPAILGELLPIEAAAVEWLALEPTHAANVDVFLAAIFGELAMTGREHSMALVHVVNLERLGLCKLGPPSSMAEGLNRFLERRRASREIDASRLDDIRRWIRSGLPPASWSLGQATA